MKSSIQEQQLSQQQIIRRHGYELTPPSSFTLPTATKHASLIKSLFGLFTDDSREKSIFNAHAPKTCTILDQKMAVLYHSNKLAVIHYSVVQEKMVLQSKACFLLKQPIRRVVCAYYGHKQEKNQPFQHFAVEYVASPSISLFKADHFRTVTLEQDLRQSDKVMAMRFTSSLDIMVLMCNGKVSSYSIREGRLKKSKGNLKILLEDDQSLKNGQICTMFIDNQPKILLFYLVYSRKNQKYQLHLKEYQRDISNHLQELGTYYDVFECTTLASLSENMLVYSFGEGILIHQGLTVYVLQKRFGKYIRSDVISQLSNARRVMLIERNDHVFLCSLGEAEIEFWEVIMKDVGCSLHLLDVVQADGALLAGKLIKVWIFVHSKKPQLALLADSGPRQVDFYLTRKLDKLAKLTGRVRKQEDKLENTHSREQKKVFVARLRQMQELGGKLGFKRREFYLKLWHQSQKNSAHIVEFLLACKDFKVIFNEISLFLRVKKLTVTQTIRILKRIEQSLLQELTRSLELQLLRQFLKTNFQRRKLKLYSGQVQLDFQQYQIIYEASLFDLIQRSIDLRLFPQKFKHDIVWKEQVQEKPIQIPYILRQFRLLILQDYPGFLLHLLQPYGSHLREVIEAYPYLLPQFPLKISMVREELVMLSNIYQAEKIQEQQYSWLGYIRQNEWQREASSLDFLHRHLFTHHPTSLISDKLRQFTQGSWCTRNKYSRHILLEANRKEFQAKLPTISDGSSLLFLCERANRLALDSGSQSESQAIVEVMHRHNHLPLPQYYLYRLFCTLHHILIRQRLQPSTTTIMELMRLPSEKLVACFFLGDRQRIQLLFQEIARHYPSRTAFNSIVEAFVGSGQCSKVELELLTNYLHHQGEHYQQENQDLIAIVLRGFLKRIQVREKDKAVDFLNLFRRISLSQQLLITLAIFQSVKVQCASILKTFDLNCLTYDTVINDPTKVITSITHEFFSNSNIHHRSIYIEGREVHLGFPQNLFVILLYLKDKVYSFIQQMQVYMIFCEAILGWNQFQLLKTCFNEDIVIDQREYLPQQFYNIVVEFMLEKYYEDETLLYCEQTKEHISQLLSLIDSSAQIAVVERSKMDFVAAIEPLGQSVSVQYMQIIRQQWEKEEQRNDLFKDIIDLFPQIDFQLAIHLYQSLQRIRCGSPHVTIKTDQFVQFALYICRKYLQTGQYGLICQVISFLNAGEHEYRAKYSFMIQCFLQVLNDRLQSPHHLRHSFLKVDKLAELAICKELIDYFLCHFDQPAIITQFFSDKFEQVNGESVSDQIQIDGVLCFSSIYRSLSRSNVWQMIVKNIISSSDSYTKSTISNPNKQKNGRMSISNNALDTKTILFTYYFICNIFSKSRYLFELDQITFNHLQNVTILQQLSKEDNLKYTINFKLIYREYLKGLFKIYYLMAERESAKPHEEELPVLEHRVSLDLDVKIQEIRSIEDSKLLLLITDLPLDKSQLELIRAMKKLIVLFQTAYTPVEEKSQRVVTMKTITNEQHSLPLYFQAGGERELKESVTQMALPHQDQTLQPKTFKFLQFQRMKKQITSKSNIISEKFIIGKVLDQLQNNLNRQQMAQQSFIDQKFTINKFIMQEEKESADQLQIGKVLEDFNQQKSNELIAIDLSDIKTFEQDQVQLNEIKQLMQNKEFEKITANYPTKAILKAIDYEFYQRLDPQQSTKPKKRINRANTLKESILHSKIITLLQALDGLKLYGGTSKVRILRSCLTTISSEQLQSVQTSLLGVFKLNILLDATKNTNNLAKYIFDNTKQSFGSINLGKFKIIVKIIQGFIKKCREQIFSTHSLKHIPKNFPNYHEAAELYCQYLSRLSKSTRTDKQKQFELQQIMTILGKQELLSIHQKLLNILSQGQLYVPYLQLIHKLYVDAT